MLTANLPNLWWNGRLLGDTVQRMENIFLPDITLPLYKQYASLFEDFYKNYPTLEGPFLVSITERYISQKTRLLFIGQQTNSWERTLNIHTQQKFYEDFNFGEKLYISFLIF